MPLAPALVLFSYSNSGPVFWLCPVPSFPLVLPLDPTDPTDPTTPEHNPHPTADGNKLPITKVFHSKAIAVVVAADFASVAAFDSVTPSHLLRFPLLSWTAQLIWT